jgi:hypothetical protein
MIKIIDNVTSPANAIYLESLMLDQPWYYLKSTAYNQLDVPSRPYDQSWVSMIYNYDTIMNSLMTLTQSILVKALYEQNMSISKLIRIRAGLTTRTPHPIIHAPHVDWDTPHMTALYYVNDSDGDTVLYEEKKDNTHTESSYQWSKDKKFTIDQTVSPKADRMVIFDGLTYHSSTSCCQNDHRIVINFNWLP